MPDEGWVVQTRFTANSTWYTNWPSAGGSPELAMAVCDGQCQELGGYSYEQLKSHGLARVVRCVAVGPEVESE